jgi:hypothetical protein
MVAMKAWYDPDDDEPLVINTAIDADALIDRVLAECADHFVPPLIQLSRRDADGWAVLEVGLSGERGLVAHTDNTGAVISHGSDRDDGKTIAYDYMGNVRELPQSAEISLASVRRAVHVFVDTNGARPTGIQWRAVE